MKQEIRLESFAGSMAVPGERPRIITLPTRIILNEAGVSFFQKHDQNPQQFNDSEGSSRYGFDMEAIDLYWLKQMILKDFVATIEMRIQEIARSSDALSDAIRLVFFSMFRHRITFSVLDRVYTSPLLLAWNRTNPKYFIGPGVSLPRQTLKNILVPFNDLVLQIQAKLRSVIAFNIKGIKKKWDNEENCDLFIDEIIQDLDPLVLFILIGSKEEDRKVLLRNVASQIISFTNMIEVLDMASLLSIELASAAERSALIRVMMQQSMNALLMAEPKLKSFMKESKFKGTTIVVSIPEHTHKHLGRLKFRISFYNDVADADLERKLFNERNGHYGPENKLDDYFQKEGVYEDNTMRFFYLTKLNQLCDKHNIKIDSSISSTKRDAIYSPGRNPGSIVTTLSFGL